MDFDLTTFFIQYGPYHHFFIFNFFFETGETLVSLLVDEEVSTRGFHEAIVGIPETNTTD